MVRFGSEKVPPPCGVATETLSLVGNPATEHVVAVSPSTDPRAASSTKSPANPRFSIVVPAYNEASYLGASLQALQQQDFRGPYEIIVVDNNSTDDTAAVAASYGVRVVHLSLIHI